MATLLGDRSSASPVPAGRPARVPVGAAGSLAFPAAGNWIQMAGGGAQLGPFNLPYRYWLCCGVNNIFYSAVAWTRYDICIRLVVNGAYGADLNGQLLHQNADSENAAMWDGGSSLEAKFYCEANTNYHVQNLTYITPANPVNYYQHPDHQNMYAYTVGEGVY